MRQIGSFSRVSRNTRKTMFTLKWILLTLAMAVPVRCNKSQPYWGYECRESQCVRVKLSPSNLHSATALSTCRLYCGGKLRTVWPKPTGAVRIEQYGVPIKPRAIQYDIPTHPSVKQLWRVNVERFASQIAAKIADPKLLRIGGATLTVKITTTGPESRLPSLTYDTDESYTLNITNSHHCVLAEIRALSFFGARHGLETLSQLIAYDENAQKFLIIGEAEIDDAPKYKHRGVLLDTARNFISMKTIKRTIDAMAMNKMNRFHWHLTAKCSFPLVIESHPDLHTTGAYSPQKIYTHEDIADLVEYARARGVSVFPEIEAPGNVGEGWQEKNMTLCFNAQPWRQHCPSPPCGMLDPLNQDVYSVLEDIYREMFEIFDLDVLHMGGSLVTLGCWKDTRNIRNWMQTRGWGLEESDFVKLWDYFQTKALAKVDQVSQNEKVPIIVRADRLVGYLDTARYIIQTMGAKGSDEIKNALQKGHRVILSNYDALFLDCGFENRFGDGNNWCGPYKGWQTIYENRPKKIAGDKSHLILGAETANWGEQLDEHSVDVRFWPRSSALAERMWSDPDENWREAKARMLVHRARLVENGIGAEGLQPEWCLLYEGVCT